MVGCMFRGCRGAVTVTHCVVVPVKLITDKPPPTHYYPHIHTQTQGQLVEVVRDGGQSLPLLQIVDASATITNVVLRQTGAQPLQSRRRLHRRRLASALVAAPEKGGIIAISAPLTSGTRRQVTLTGVQMIGGAATRGGLVFITGAVDVVMRGCRLEGGVAVVGGAVFVADGATLSLVDTVVVGSTAERDGGGVYVAAGAVLTMLRGSDAAALAMSTVVGNAAG